MHGPNCKKKNRYVPVQHKQVLLCNVAAFYAISVNAVSDNEVCMVCKVYDTDNFFFFGGSVRGKIQSLNNLAVMLPLCVKKSYL
jgi:hypothetical protein